MVACVSGPLLPQPRSPQVTTVPSFVFFVDGKEVGRYSGADRGQLMAAVLEIQVRVRTDRPRVARTASTSRGVC